MHECIDLLGRAAGAGYLGEAVSQLDHALQCAHFARAAGGSDELVLAALLHDIGHLVPGAAQMAGLGAEDHEEVGARFLAARGFGTEVCELVRGHVAAKRYLAGRNDVYKARLSSASLQTLELQGGPMTAVQAAAFERDPRFRDKVRLRKLDELGKDPHLSVAPLSTYLPALERHLEIAR